MADNQEFRECSDTKPTEPDFENAVGITNRMAMAAMLASNLRHGAAQDAVVVMHLPPPAATALADVLERRNWINPKQVRDIAVGSAFLGLVGSLSSALLLEGHHGQDWAIAVMPWVLGPILVSFVQAALLMWAAHIKDRA